MKIVILFAQFCSISAKQWKYFCQILKVTRRHYLQDDLVKDIVNNELSTSCSCLDYRQLSEFININYNWTVSKGQVRKCLKVVDPGVKERWRKVIRCWIYKTDGSGGTHIAAQNKFIYV